MLRQISHPSAPAALALLLMMPGAADAQAIAPAHIRDAATRGVAAIQGAQRVSQKTQACASTCHLQGYGSMAVRAALDHGIPVDEAIARADGTRAFGRLAGDLVAAIERNGLTEPAMNGYGNTSVIPSLERAAVAAALREPVRWFDQHLRSQRQPSSR